MMKGALQNIFIILVMATITIPGVLTLLDVKLVENCEKRELHTLPKASFSEKYIADFEDYFDDNFGLRNLLVNWGSTMKVNLFKSSLHPQNVKFGKFNWLFYNKLDSEIFNSYSKQNLLSPSELDSTITNWENCKTALEKKEIKYIMAVWPNKATIYPEFLPSTMKMQIKYGISKTDQIKNFLQITNSKIPFIDVRSSLLEKKKENQLYHKHDTHWNELGAYYAYRDFFKQTKGVLGIEPYNLDSFLYSEKAESKGDLLNMIGICDNSSFIDIHPKLQYKQENLNLTSFDGKFKNSLVYVNENCKNNLRVLVFRDSFTDALIPYFRLHFRETHFVWFDFQEHIVESIKPDVVITSFVERNL